MGRRRLAGAQRAPWRVFPAPGWSWPQAYDKNLDKERNLVERVCTKLNHARRGAIRILLR